MAIKMSVAEIVEKHNRRLKASIEDIRNGVNRVDKAPSELAVAKQDKMKAKLIASIDNGKWASNLRKVDLASWKDKMITKGLGRISTGIDGATAKTTDFYTQFLPVLNAAQSKIATMSDLTLEDSINRMNTFVREVAKFKKK